MTRDFRTGHYDLFRTQNSKYRTWGLSVLTWDLTQDFSAETYLLVSCKQWLGPTGNWQSSYCPATSLFTHNFPGLSWVLLSWNFADYIQGEGSHRPHPSSICASLCDNCVTVCNNRRWNFDLLSDMGQHQKTYRNIESQDVSEIMLSCNVENFWIYIRKQVACSLAHLFTSFF